MKTTPFLLLFAVITGLSAFVLWMNLDHQLRENRIIMMERNIYRDNQEKHEVLKLDGTCYQVTVRQCGNLRGITASGKRIHSRTCAVSRDMIDTYGGPFSFGDSLFIWSGVPMDLTGWWMVDDLTADSYNGKPIRHTIDLHTPIIFKNTLTIIR